jgi:UDP-N-acetylglucosamine:LPS N-acetylglucosamine transferase
MQASRSLVSSLLSAPLSESVGEGFLSRLPQDWLPRHSLRVVILSSDTGGGHRSAAKAIRQHLKSLAALQGVSVRVDIRRVLEESTWLNRQFAGVYNYLLRYQQPWMRYYYQWINWFKPNQSWMVLLPMWRYAKRLFQKHPPTLVVSVHPMTQHFYGLMQSFVAPIRDVPLVTVVTDPFYGFWQGWACDAVDQYLVASDEARRQLLDYAVPPERILVLGLPVGALFTPAPPLQRLQLRRTHKIPTDAMVVFFNAGFVGGGSVPALYEGVLAQLEMSATLAQAVHVVFLAGKNKSLYQQALLLARQHPSLSVTVLPHTSVMHEWMQLSDVMVSKTGALTTFEALAAGLPLFVDTVHAPMPQEAGTAQFIEARGAGVAVRSAEDICQHLQCCLASPQVLQQWREAALAQEAHLSSERIAALLFDKLLCLAFNS